ncbi:MULTISPECIES: ABC transporter substrate-binding protein [unclassified Veillonella]|uniref:ABC transporter substrate-binding protein n=1 Tax=unclassified Veillonella TaxID=2630086 RepID=UPI000F8F6BA9|nr:MULTISPECIES: ABC transporter substrate-binding protein [unclassified Veillonella]
MKKIYILLLSSVILVSVYTAYLQGINQLIPMPSYVVTTERSSKTSPRIVHQLTSKITYQDIAYDDESYRIMAVWQNSVETLLALGMGDRIIAAIGVPDSKYIAKEYRAEYEKIPYKSMQVPDVESTLLWEPDLIVGWYTTFQNDRLKSTDFWMSRGVHAYIASSSAESSLATVEGEYQYILDLGNVVNREEKAEEIVNRIQKYVKAAKEYGETHPTQDTVMIMEPAGRQFGVYDDDTLGGKMIEEIGGNLLGDVGETINIEELIDLNPSVIFVVLQEDDYEHQDEIIQRLYDNLALQHVDAIRNHRVYGIPLFMVYSAGVRIYDGLDIMIRGLYPNFESKDYI